jgi:segregation and condensation protein A
MNGPPMPVPPAAPVVRRDPDGAAVAVVGAPDAAGPGAPAPEGSGPRVTLDSFEGPLDLLLHLIREEQVDITDIPIARITDQYLATLGDLEQLDLDRAGEYLVMAAELMRIKARMLIPREAEEGEEEEVDPRAELARRLLEYREFKRVAEDLAAREEAWRGIFPRSVTDGETGPDGDDPPGVTLVDLFRAFQAVLDARAPDLPLEMEAPTFSVSDQVDAIRRELARHVQGVPFEHVFEGRRSRALLIATFLALLELVRLREIVARQAERFGAIWLARAEEVGSVDAT